MENILIQVNRVKEIEKDHWDVFVNKNYVGSFWEFDGKYSVFLTGLALSLQPETKFSTREQAQDFIVKAFLEKK